MKTETGKEGKREMKKKNRMNFPLSDSLIDICNFIL